MRERNQALLVGAEIWPRETFIATNLKLSTEHSGNPISDLCKYRYILQHPPAIPHLGIKSANMDANEAGEQTDEVLFLAAWSNICYITVLLTLLARDGFIV